MPNNPQSYQIVADALYEYSQKKYETIRRNPVTTTSIYMRKVASEHAPVPGFCENRELSGPVLSENERHISHNACAHKVTQALTEPPHKLIRSEVPFKEFILKNGHLVAPQPAFRSVKQAIVLPQDTKQQRAQSPIIDVKSCQNGVLPFLSRFGQNIFPQCVG